MLKGHLLRTSKIVGIANNETINAAADDEPLFVIRAQDKLAPTAIKIYIMLLEANGANTHKIIEAKASLSAFEKWEGPKKLPD